MQLILLSRGSSKRLCPLSKVARSKQFLPLLASSDGGMQPMKQRVVRQIREANLTDNTTFTTNTIQRDSIINLFGEDVNVVTEPERCDTFPAISIASSNISKEKITPTYPSEKFGYVLPESITLTHSFKSATFVFNEDDLRVARFTEKLNEEKVSLNN